MCVSWCVCPVSEQVGARNEEGGNAAMFWYRIVNRTKAVLVRGVACADFEFNACASLRLHRHVTSLFTVASRTFSVMIACGDRSHAHPRDSLPRCGPRRLRSALVDTRYVPTACRHVRWVWPLPVMG